MKDMKFVEKYALVIKDLFESDYHRILDDEDLVERLIKFALDSDTKVSELEYDLYWAKEELRDLQSDMDDLRDELEDLA